MENLKFILKENVVMFDEEGNILPDKVSTLGFKFTFGGEQYGSYFIINKPSVTAQDVMEALEGISIDIEQLLKKLQADTKSI